MNEWFQRQFSSSNGSGAVQDINYGSHIDSSSLLDGLSGGWQWDELAAEVSQESQACVAIAGLLGSGKSVLFNRLRGWTVSETEQRSVSLHEDGGAGNGLRLETFGAIILADLPEELDEAIGDGDALWLALGNPALVVYLLNGPLGVRQVDYRWMSLLRSGGKPVVAALNQCDLLTEVETAITEAQLRLGIKVIPISALNGDNVETELLPAILDAAPRVAIPIGREILQLRRQAAQRVVRHAAMYTGILSAQPVPLLDIPFQIMAQVGVVMRIGAAYGRPPAGGINREMIGVVAGSLTLNYLVQTVVKLVPVLGWAVSGLLGAGATWMIGEAAILYYEGAAERTAQLATDRLQVLSGWKAKAASKLAVVASRRKRKGEK